MQGSGPEGDVRSFVVWAQKDGDEGPGLASKLLNRQAPVSCLADNGQSG